MFKTISALILREVKYKEADKILTVLTPEDGKLTVKARGALRKSCRYGAACQALCYSEMTLFGSRGRWSVNEAETIEQFLMLRSDLALLALGSYFAEALEAVSDEDSPNPEILQLGLNSLYALSRRLYTPEHIKTAFELRLMCLAGFEPDVFACAVCGREESQDMLLSLRGGVMHCRGCVPEARGVSLPLSPESLDAMRYVINAEPKRIFSFAIPPESETQLDGVTQAYMSAQLKRGFATLDYWKSVRLTDKKT